MGEQGLKELELFGKKCRDAVTGFEGVCVGMTEWMYGCRQYILQPESEGGKKKNYWSYFFEKQLDVIDAGVSERVEKPVYDEPRYFGKECRDKVTGAQGICIGRTVFLFNSTQYVIEIPSEDQSRESRLMWIDEGRVEVVKDSKKEVSPAEVAGPRPGAVLSPYLMPTRMEMCGFC